MKLYHYSKKPYETLLSKNAQNNTPDKDSFNYGNNISFLLEPIPRNTPTILHDVNPNWQAGELYEYTVETSELPKDIKFRLVESDEKVELLYNKQDWSKAEGNPELVAAYVKEVKDMEMKLGLVGFGVKPLEKVCSKYNTGITKYFKEAYKLHLKNPEDKIDQKYAACVPHLMIYPGMTPIKFTKMELIELI